MLLISILKVENPSCLWGRFVQGLEDGTATSPQYDNLRAQMNLFYHDITQDLRRLKPSSIEKGQVYVVYWSVMKSWCRAVVESIVMDSVSCHVCCFLVDYGEQLVVSSDQVRVAMPNFTQLPFWMRRFHLAGIKPLTLRVSVLEKAKLVPSHQWDSSATLYLHNLLRASTQAEAVLLESESDSTAIELYLTVRGVKIAVNNDLVVKKFAFYIRKSADGSQLDEVDEQPVMLSPSVLYQLNPSRTAANKLTTQTLPSPVRSYDLAAGVTGDWLMSPSSPQRINELSWEDGSRSKVAEEQLSPGGQSKNNLDAAAAERFLKVLNPLSSYQQTPTSSQPELTDSQPEETTSGSVTCQGPDVQAPSTASAEQSHPPYTREADRRYEEASLRASEQNEDDGVSESRLVKEEARSGASGASEKIGRSEEEQICSWFLEWLNPELLNSDPDAAGKEVVRSSDPWRDGILVHSLHPVEPCSSLDDAPVTDTLRRVLRRKQYSSLSAADRYSWPAVTRGCNTVIISPSADQPLSYLPPLLTHILLNSIHCTITSSTGPIAVLLCPGWEKVQAMYDLLDELKVTLTLHPVVAVLGVGKDEATDFKIPKNCMLLVTTPFSLARLLSCHCFQFLRMYHLVLDEADQLFTHAPEQMATILQHFQKVVSSKQNASCPQQLIAVSKRWTSHMEGLLANHMPQPFVIITVPEEVALYGNVQQIILMTLESSKISVLLSTLDLNPSVGQKTLIIANSAQEVENIFKAVTSKSAFCLMTHEGLTHQFDFVIQQWRKDIGPGTHVILVTTNTCLKCLGIRDANCVVHYSFPASPKMFGSQLFSMAENFRNYSERVSSLDQSESDTLVARSVLLISERNARHIVGVHRYLVRTNALLPPELVTFAQGLHMVQEDQKTSRPLCRYIKSYGACRDSGVCPDRHRFIPQLDQSVLPAAGVIDVLPLYVKTASVFYGCIISKGEASVQSLLSEMTSYYADKKPGAKELLEGNLYAVQEDEVFHRVKILSIPDKGSRLFFSVLVRFIDVGKEREVRSYQILQLPEQFHSLPDQAVEFILCRVKPADEETDWHPKATRAISQKIKGLQHRAVAVFSLGNTVFVDPMVRVTQIPGVKVVINEYNVQSEILKTGMAVSNPEHLDLLKALCQETKTNAFKEAGSTSGSENGPVSLEVRIEVEPCEPLAPESPVIPSLVPALPEHQKPPAAAEPRLVSVCDQTLLCEAQQSAGGQRNSHPTDLKLAEQMTKFVLIEDGQKTCPAISQAAQANHGEPAGDSNSSPLVIGHSPKSFHPQVRWYQSLDSVIVTVKLRNPDSQRCDFYSDRVVYSGRVNSQTYRADLDLHASIAADLCHWEMKSSEPVLTLVKQQKGFWEKFLKSKNIFVSYDMDHYKEDKDKIPNGLWFVGNTGDDQGEDHWSLDSQSDSDSD